MKQEGLKAGARKSLYLYQRVFFYIAQAKNEALKPLGFWNETLLILTFLAVSNQRPSLPIILLSYIAVLAMAALIGKLIVSMGIVKYNTRISNHQNPELMMILEEIKKLREELKSNGK